MEENLAKKYILDLLFSQNQCKNNCIFGLDVQALQNAKSICLPSEVISFFSAVFPLCFWLLTAWHWHVVQLAWARKIVSSGFVLRRYESCVPCPQCHHAYQTVTPQLPWTYTTFTMLLTQCRQQNPWTGHTSRWQWPLAMAHWQWERSGWSWAEEIPLGQG